MSKNSGLDKITYAELHSYTFCEFVTKKSFQQLIDSLRSSPIMLDNYRETLLRNMQIKAKQMGCKSGVIQTDNIKIKYITFDKLSQNQKMTFNDKDSYFEERTTADNAMQTILDTHEIDDIELKTELTKGHLHVFPDIYGLKLNKDIAIFLFAPAQAVLDNGEQVTVATSLYLFKNKQGVLKQEYPLRNVTTQNFYDNNKDKYFTSFYTTWPEQPKKRYENELELREAYFDKLCKDLNLKIRSNSKDFCNLILADFPNQPTSLYSIPLNLKRDLFRIVSAPCKLTDTNRVDSLVKEHFQKYFSNYGDIATVFKTNGGCLFLIKRDLISQPKSSKQNDDRTFENHLKHLITSVSFNAELAILVSVLTRNNNIAFLNWDTPKQPDYELEKMNYYDNRLAIIHLQENCYGSVNEQIKEFKEKMPLFFDEELTQEKLDIVDFNLTTKDNRRKESFKRFLETSSLVLALLLGLPAIKQTLDIISTIFSAGEGQTLLSTNLNMISFILWLLFTLLLLIKLITSRVKTSHLMTRKKQQ